ncbi:RNA 2',3'-cyclic phosphodiesterase [Sporosarcina aquimarina]|uniref:RNA 2',3'-cyclic phosphodiesterase n=1 Tax=Sporosarcina aquimarina TaxID=114975 RepID=UPI001C8D53BD|nr:RNA 2',3'-cyclic phosphodiesterase [Sporosarcina aquimarina]MBY0223811.1 RNA 2',3'-cyclic phosphodiesterase [Sporosarcina aquimarina]
MAQHYFIGISIATPISKIAEHFRSKYQLAERYKVIPHADDLHITMRYIGELGEATKSLLEPSLQEIAEANTSFTTSVTGLSFFGSPYGPRVVYLSVEAVGALEHLQRQIARRTENILELEKDNRFVPHITIAKKRKTADKIQLSKETITPVQIDIEGFTLFRIHPNVRPSYESVAYFPFKKS